MYEQMGVHVAPGHNLAGTSTVKFRVFFPGPVEYVAAGGPRIAELKVIGSFQDRPWDVSSAPLLTPGDYVFGGIPAGILYEHTLELPDGYYEYVYWVRFDNGEERPVCDPCARYGGRARDHQETSAFVVGGSWPAVERLASRLPLAELVIYELMIDDFAKELVCDNPRLAPLEVVKGKIRQLKEDLGINAISFMPWTAWPGGEFSWGYNPAYYFSVEQRYMDSPERPLDKLALLRELINECHEQNVHVIMDGVFNHAEGSARGGFPYVGLYEQECESPFVGTFAGGGFFKNLDFNCECTQQFVFDVCRYWIEEFGIDGIRFDYTLGFWHPDDRGHGLNRLMLDLRRYCRDNDETNFALILEHMSDNRYEAINVVNQVGATACWFDPFLFVAHRFLGRKDGDIVDLELLRIFDSQREFDPGHGPITYLENHDHTSLTAQAGGRTNWARTQPYLIALFTAPGAPMIHNGQEWGEDYPVPDSGADRVTARPLRWSRRSDEIGTTLIALYHKLIAIRSAHPALRGPNVQPTSQPDWARDLDPQGYGVSRHRSLACIRRWGPLEGRQAEYVILLNFSGETRGLRVELPAAGEWEDLLSGWTLHVEADRYHDFEVGSNWGHILCHRA